MNLTQIFAILRFIHAGRNIGMEAMGAEQSVEWLADSLARLQEYSLEIQLLDGSSVLNWDHKLADTAEQIRTCKAAAKDASRLKIDVEYGFL